MNKMKRVFTTFCMSMLLLTGFTSQAQDDNAKEFKGKIGTTLDDSQEYWPEPVKAPEGAPNVLIWLIDDMGYGHSSAFGGLTPMPTRGERHMYRQWKS